VNRLAKPFGTSFIQKYLRARKAGTVGGLDNDRLCGVSLPPPLMIDDEVEERGFQKAAEAAGWSVGRTAGSLPQDDRLNHPKQAKQAKTEDKRSAALFSGIGVVRGSGPYIREAVCR